MITGWCLEFLKTIPAVLQCVGLRLAETLVKWLVDKIVYYYLFRICTVAVDEWIMWHLLMCFQHEWIAITSNLKLWKVCLP